MGEEEVTAFVSSLFALLTAADASGSTMPVASGVALDAAPVDYAAALSASVIL